VGTITKKELNIVSKANGSVFYTIESAHICAITINSKIYYVLPQ